MELSVIMTIRLRVVFLRLFLQQKDITFKIWAQLIKFSYLVFILPIPTLISHCNEQIKLFHSSKWHATLDTP